MTRGPRTARRWAVAVLAVTASIVTVPAAAVALPPNPPSIAATRTALARLTVHSQTLRPAYERSAFGTWISQGGCTTRERVLIRDGLDTTAGEGCAVTAVHWRSIYDGAIITASSKVQIDHIAGKLRAAVGPHTEALARRLLSAPDHPTPLTRARHRRALARAR